MRTGASKLIEFGVARGVARGVAQGVAQGEANALLRLLASRFGEVPESVKDQVTSAESSVLLDWIDAAVTADRLDDVFAARA